MKKDTISRIICESLNLRAYTINSLETVKTITGIHETTPNATVALGRTINAAGLLSATLKPDSNQNLTVRFHGNGPIKEILVQADAIGNIRGYAGNPAVDITEDIGKISFSKTIGAGFLDVTKDIGLKEPYKSVTPLQTGEVASDIAYYLTASEQVPSAVILGLYINKEAQVLSSGGILIQTFPDTAEEAIEILETNITKKNINLGEELKEGADIYSIVSELFNNEALTITETYPVQASCRCSKELLYSVLHSIAANELETMHREDKGAEMTCSFCKSQYHFSEEELKIILDNKNSVS